MTSNDNDPNQDQKEIKDDFGQPKTPQNQPLQQSDNDAANTPGKASTPNERQALKTQSAETISLEGDVNATPSNTKVNQEKPKKDRSKELAKASNSGQEDSDGCRLAVKKTSTKKTFSAELQKTNETLDKTERASKSRSLSREDDDQANLDGKKKMKKKRKHVLTPTASKSKPDINVTNHFGDDGTQAATPPPDEKRKPKTKRFTKNVRSPVEEERSMSERKRKKKGDAGQKPKARTPIIETSERKKKAPKKETSVLNPIEQRFEKKEREESSRRVKRKDSSVRIQKKAKNVGLEVMKYVPQFQAMFPQRKKDLKFIEGFFKRFVVNTRSHISSLRLNKSDDTFIANPETHLKQIDVNAEYGVAEDFGPLPEKSYDNPNNSGQLFPKGRPFWCNKDEKPPRAVPFSQAMRDYTAGKWSLVWLKDKETHDFDPYANLDVLKSRDAEYFKKDKIILSNTVRSTVALFTFKQKFEKGFIFDESLREPIVVIPTPKYSISFVGARQLVQYYRKDRKVPMKFINYTSGVTAVTRKKSKDNGGTFGGGSVRRRRE